MPTARIEIENTNNQWHAEVEAGYLHARRALVRHETFEGMIAEVIRKYEELSGTPLDRNQIMEGWYPPPSSVEEPTHEDYHPASTSEPTPEPTHPAATTKPGFMTSMRKK